MGGYSALAVANYFLSNYKDTGITPLKIQKLTYIAHGWHLALLDEPLVSDEFSEAWRYGPVFPSLYHAFKYRRNLPIIELGTELEFNDDGTFIRKVPEIEKDDGTTKGLLDRIWEVYGTWSGSQLSEFCHKPGTPWDKTWKDNQGQKNANIDNDLIKKHYLEKLEQDNDATAAKKTAS